MTVIVIGAQNHTVAVRETVAEIREQLDLLEEHELHVQLTALDGEDILIHKQMLDLVTA